MDGLKYLNNKITFDEIPGYLMLCITITGCPLRCVGCHSKELRNGKMGYDLDISFYDDLYLKYKNDIDGICFLGGEWNKEIINHFIKIKSYNWLIGLYSGYELKDISKEIINYLDFLKCGPYIENLGGLDQKETNQFLIEMKTQKIILGKNKGKYVYEIK